MQNESELFASIYTDEDITGKLAIALRQRGFKATTAYEAGLGGRDDESQLVYAAQHSMILLTCNRDDFIRLAREWAVKGQKHYGIVISQQFPDCQFGQLLHLTLNLLDRVAADDLVNSVCFLTSFS